MTVVESAKTRGLTTAAKVLSELGLSGEPASSEVGIALLEATAAIENYCNRIFARQRYSEDIPGLGFVQLMVSQAPLKKLVETTKNDSAFTDAVIGDEDAGIVYLETGWEWQPKLYSGIGDHPHVGSEYPNYGIDYWAGWVLPGDDYTATTISASSTDNSLNDSASLFPRLVAGDAITISGFTSPATANNVETTVTSRTAAKIIVAATLTTKAAGDSVKLTVRNLPYDIERAAIELTKALYQHRGRDYSVSRRKIGDTDISYRAPAGGGAVNFETLYPGAAAMLRPYIRIMNG